MWWQRRRDDQDAPVRDEVVLTRETEAFLTGRLVQKWHDEWLTVPNWGWLTVLAHGGIAEIAALTDAGTYWSPSERAWGPALGFLAGEILTRAGTEEALQELQRSALIPLELQALRVDGGAGLDPSQLVRNVLAAVADVHPTPH